jgi:hypothetical protein
MKNFYTNRNFNFLTLFTKNKDIDYKLRFNQDIFTQREFDPSLKKPQSTALINNIKKLDRANIKQTLANLKEPIENENIANSHFAWKDTNMRIRRINQIKTTHERHKEATL